MNCTIVSNHSSLSLFVFTFSAWLSTSTVILALLCTAVQYGLSFLLFFFSSFFFALLSVWIDRGVRYHVCSGFHRVAFWEGWGGFLDFCFLFVIPIFFLFSCFCPGAGRREDGLILMKSGHILTCIYGVPGYFLPFLTLLSSFSYFLIGLLPLINGNGSLLPHSHLIVCLPSSPPLFLVCLVTSLNFTLLFLFFILLYYYYYYLLYFSPHLQLPSFSHCRNGSTVSPFQKPSSLVLLDWEPSR